MKNMLNKKRLPFYFDPYSSGLFVFLGPTEAELMELAWDKQELTVKKALFYLGSNSDRAYTTVMTVLSRLEKKGFLFKEKEGRSFIYRPVNDRKTFLSERLAVIKKCMNNF